MLIDLLNIMNNDANASDIENQITKNSMAIRLKQKHSSAKISEIRAKYQVEEEKIRNKIDSLDEENSSKEYEDLMTELKELRDMEDDEVEAEENAATDYETDIQLENDNLSTRLEAMKADTESLKELHQKNIEDLKGKIQIL